MTTILLAEDEGIILLSLADALELAGLTVITASNGQQALSRLTPDVDLIVTDVMMPRLDGFSLIREVRRRSELEAMPVIFMSGAVVLPPEFATERFLGKPFPPSTLLALIEEMVDTGR